MAIRARSVGELLDGAFRLYREDLGLYMFMAIVASVPMSLFTVLSLTASDTFGSNAAILAVLPVALLVTVALWTALVHQMSERLDGREPAFAPSVRRAAHLSAASKRVRIPAEELGKFTRHFHSVNSVPSVANLSIQ